MYGLEADMYDMYARMYDTMYTSVLTHGEKFL